MDPLETGTATTVVYTVTLLKTLRLASHLYLSIVPLVQLLRVYMHQSAAVIDRSDLFCREAENRWAISSDHDPVSVPPGDYWPYRGTTAISYSTRSWRAYGMYIRRFTDRL